MGGETATFFMYKAQCCRFQQRGVEEVWHWESLEPWGLCRQYRKVPVSQQEMLCWQWIDISIQGQETKYS